MATATERKFTGLRKRLDQVGYRQPLGLESLPLVDKLFGDLLHTTESLKTAKQQLGKHREEKVTSIVHSSLHWVGCIMAKGSLGVRHRAEPPRIIYSGHVPF